MKGILSKSLILITILAMAIIPVSGAAKTGLFRSLASQQPQLGQDCFHRERRSTRNQIDDLNGQDDDDQGDKWDQQGPPLGDAQRFL